MSNCPEKISLYWLAKKLDEDSTFAVEAMGVIHRMNEHKPKIQHGTNTPASSASHVLNEWLVARDLLCYSRGREIEDYRALTVEPIDCSWDEAVDMLNASITVHRDDFVALIEREGMTVPEYLKAAPKQQEVGSLTAMKKERIINKYRPQWETVENDLTEASRNGLNAARVPNQSGYYYEEKAVKWATDRGRLKAPAAKPSMSDLPGRLFGQK